MDVEYWIVIAEDETYHKTPDDAENLHRVGLPIVSGPYDDYDVAFRESPESHTVVVGLPRGTVEGWDEA